MSYRLNVNVSRQYFSIWIQINDLQLFYYCLPASYKEKGKKINSKETFSYCFIIVLHNIDPKVLFSL